MRAFLALNLSKEIKNKYAGILKIDENIAELKKVPANKMHITLAFFENINESHIELIKEKTIISSPCAFNINFEDISYFTNKFKDINVIFIKAVSKELEDYVKILRRNLDSISQLKYDKKEFKSHITLARVKKLYNNEKLKEKIVNIDFTPEYFLADSITLYSSDFVNYTELFNIHFYTEKF